MQMNNVRYKGFKQESNRQFRLEIIDDIASQQEKLPDQNFFLKINKRGGPDKLRGGSEKFRKIDKRPPRLLAT